MTESGATLRRHLLPWDRPLPAQAAAWLAGDWSGAGPLDLSHVLVVVPTRQSGRRLREALAEHAHARGGAVLAPRVVLPEDLLAMGRTAPDIPVASRLENQLAWVEVLRGVDLDEFREVFPVDPPARNFSWAKRLAAQFIRVQAALAEGGLGMADVVRRAGDDLPEAERWRQLGELEQRHAALLATVGRRSPQARLIASAFRPVCPVGISRLVLLATPDPFPLARVALETLARALPVDVVIYGPPESDADFDAWGRPQDEAWRARPPELDFTTQVRLCLDPAEQASELTELARGYGAPEGRLAIGIGDPEVAPVLEHRLRSAGLAVYNPAGQSWQQGGFHALLAALGNLVREPAFDVAQGLGRCPDFLAWLAAQGAYPAETWLRELDALHQAHLPATVAAALRHAGERTVARRGLEAILELRESLVSGSFPENAAATLDRLLAHREIPAETAEVAQAWMEVLREAETARALAPGLTKADWWELTLGIYGEGRRDEPRQAGAMELLGWSELLWDDTPHLVIAGFNDGRIPETVVGDAFLPEALRARLGLATNEGRFARDVYLLSALAAARRERGQLDLLVGKTSLAGDPLRPSRLLLLCRDDELPGRVAQLFRPAPVSRASPPWRRAWKLRPPVLPPPARVSVTAFRDYLQCPFRFYLKHVLRMEAFDPFKSELDAFDFGTLCHHALEAMGQDPVARESSDPAALKRFLVARLDEEARRRFGGELTLPLIVQLESARQRLGRAAEVQAAERAAGWRIEAVEHKFELSLGPVTVSGRIDRIEKHAETGQVRVIDYKTSDQAVTPLAAHVRPARRQEEAPDWACFRRDGKDWVWTDLQLPLYLEALAAEFGEGVTAGYFNLPKAVGETALLPWTGYDAADRAEARRCAEGVAAAVAAGKFWPPAELSARDEDDRFAGLFHQGTAASVEWEGAR